VHLFAQYCLPTAIACLEGYTGGAMAAGLLTGLVNGYNGSVFDPSPCFNADLATYLSERAGMCIGTAISLGSPKAILNVTNAATGIATREVSSMTTNLIAANGRKCLNWFATNSARTACTGTTRKATQVAEQQLAKHVPFKGKYVNLASPSRTEHILFGNGTGGGHLFPAKPGKTPFPASWGPDKIMHYVSDVATDPGIVWKKATKPGFIPKESCMRYEAVGIREGVKIRTIIEPHGEGIITGYPI
jgi:hypothetical protein